MPLDFEQEYGVNAGYVEALFEDWKEDASSVDEAWREIFERATGEPGGQPPAAPSPEPPLPTPEERSAARAAPARTEEDGELELLAGVGARIAANMEASLEIPTATSVRTIPCKVLLENRRILNEHMGLRAYGKASFTHLVAFALARTLGEMPRMIASYVTRDDRGHRKIPNAVNLGLAIDVPDARGGGRMLVVPSIKDAASLGFREFHAAYEDLVRRGREGKLDASDYAGTNVTLTNPGGFGTEMSVPRLMKGQGLIVATGTIGVPPQVAAASAAALAELAVGPVMTMTSTYDHRVIQGAESGLFLRRVEELLLGGDGFYEEVFGAMRVPWQPYAMARDVHAPAVSGHDAEGGRSDGESEALLWRMINAYRVRGCRLADLDPLEYRPDPIPSLDPATYGFTIWDLDRRFLCGGMAGERVLTLREILDVLRRAYCRRWSIEYMHISNWERKTWIRDRIEGLGSLAPFSREEILETLDRLYRAENFERFLHTKYVGNKRFSLEGADSLIPALGEVIERASESGVEKVVIGMAHRGRLNVLVNILDKTYEQVFREFEGVLLPLSHEGSGDVKYHLGQRGMFTTRAGKKIEVFLSANPSHLEAVDPVVCGMTRAYQDAMRDADRKRVLAVLIHGDAAFSGQGVVAETLNMSQLRAYGNGGTIHLVVNNQIGFTAGPRDLRSTYYCTDVAKSVQAPILHANGDYPESVLRSVRIAVDYQREFGADAVVDMVCYRRWGHNEGDEPAYTQPVLYSKIRRHPTVCETYTALLQRRGDLEEEEVAAIASRFDAELNEARRRTIAVQPTELAPEELIDLRDDDPADRVQAPSPETGVPAEQLVEVIDRTNEMPQGHVVHPNLLRQLRRRERMVRGEQGVDWGCAEALAFGTLLHEAVSIRLSGQDSGRGTFSHRHAVIRDQVTEADHVPLQGLGRGGADFHAWDSLLSEEAVLAFEYGYSLARPDALVLWEAQFGDFVNGAQIPIDQFIGPGETKWKEKSGVTLLLPHGFDGMGPEHSSARPERFLALCSSGNMTVANCTTSAQYFHLVRRQGLASDKRPLVVFTPKSLLRDKRAASDVGALAAGRFHEVLPDEAMPAQPRRVVLCSGKVFYDLEAFRAENGHDDVAIVRVEQLYPLPADALKEVLDAAPGAELLWCQEEPRNMGAWSFVFQRLDDLGISIRYCGRPESPSPATGSHRRHVAEQEHLVRRAFAEEEG
jgi:2-oxoglutarate dehydrogenase E1 component